uniref:Uncharacterized protein n=1 Tax=Nelumbo nucifera TaxID=4432 RepID=A0A822XEJ8_NELNU|nr:TPA_asm: hypothetical protein HUJ06_020213 [Nelumbo nucifera]
MDKAVATGRLRYQTVTEKVPPTMISISKVASSSSSGGKLDTIYEDGDSHGCSRIRNQRPEMCTLDSKAKILGI